MLRGLVFLAALGAAASASAGEQLFAGQVQKIVLRPSGVNGCPPPCPEAQPDEHGITRVCVSNQGGCQSTDIPVQQVFLGDARPGSTITVESRTGEWGGTTFPSGPAPVLVSLDERSHRWAELATRDGKLFFKAARLPQLGGIDPRALPADADGMVSLDQLLARIHAAR